MIKTQTVITDSDSDPNVEARSVTRAIQYRQGTMRRREATSIVDIANCETRTGFLVDLDRREYRNYKVVTFASEAQRGEYLQKTGKTAIQVESKTVDTGDRKVFFGYPARHLITTTRRADANADAGGEEILDGWYIDHELIDRSCAPDFVRTEPYYLTGSAVVDYPDIAQIHHTGPLPTGLAVKLKFISKLGTKKSAVNRTITVEETIEELSDSPLSPSLFQLPNGLHENPELLRGHTAH